MENGIFNLHFTIFTNKILIFGHTRTSYQSVLKIETLERQCLKLFSSD